MTTPSASRRPSRILHFIWITALLAAVAVPDGAGARKTQRLIGSNVLVYASSGH